MRYLHILLILLLPSSMFAQQHFYLGAQLDAGLGKGTFTENKQVLKSSVLGPSFFTPKLHVAYRWKNLITLEAGVSQSIFNWNVKDAHFSESQNGDYEVILRNNAGFVSYFGTFMIHPRIDKHTYVYAALGYGSSYYGTGEVNTSEEFALDGQQFEMTSYYKNKSTKYFQPEIGMQWITKDKNLFSIGLTYYMAQNSDYVESDYVNLDGFGDTLNTDAISTSSNHFGVNMRYNYLLHYIPKKERAKKPKNTPTVPEIVVEDTSYTPLPIDEDDEEQTVNDRDYNVTNKITVHSNTVTIRVWDHQIVDGDRINLALNGNWILENFTLEAKKKEIKVTLPDGKSDLILYALNLGKYSPNTAAIEVYDGDKNQFLILESNLEESGALEIKVKE